TQANPDGPTKDRSTADPGTMDAQQPIAPLNFPARHIYSTRVAEKPCYLEPEKFEHGPDLMESWETSPDGLQITMKLRQGVKWHNKPPVNGRALDMDDVLFSWDRFARKSQGRLNVVNAVNPDAPVLSFAATDSKTVVVKL